MLKGCNWGKSWGIWIKDKNEFLIFSDCATRISQLYFKKNHYTPRKSGVPISQIYKLKKQLNTLIHEELNHVDAAKRHLFLMNLNQPEGEKDSEQVHEALPILMNGIKTHYWQLLSMMDKLTQLANELAITNMKHQIETGTADSKLLDRRLA